jgi:ligand-binding SRPBCC domain-containing protein
MPIITLATEIHAPIERCFDLCRDLELHTQTVPHTRERLVGDKKTGLAELGDVLVFEAVHLGIRQRLSSQITEVDRPVLFADVSLSGAFQSLRHEHRFTAVQTATGPATLMRDRLEWTSPLGPLGKIADILFLKRYMLRFLVTRNRNLKTIIEAEQA